MATSELRDQINQAIQAIRTKTNLVPEVGIILGTGLGGLVKEIKIETEIPYEQIPHFVKSTVEFHAGKLIFGELGGKKIIAMQGRFHYYEGYDMKQITFPVRVMKFLGAQTLVVSNACGGMNPRFKAGDLMIITDHINLLGTNPLIGPNDETIGPRFPDMSQPYTQNLIRLAQKIASKNKVKIRKGIFVAWTGPNLETRAEYRFLRSIGADAVGMSTVPEVIVAVHMSMNVLGLSVITDECFPDSLQPADIGKIVKNAIRVEPKLTLIMKEVIRQM
jgi:purine-nucleoside phosphorylase